MDVPLDHPLLRAAARSIDRWGLVSPGERVLVAVSGGADSVALLLALEALAQQPGRRYRLHLAHLDHRLRGAEGEADARFVARLGRRLGLPLASERRTPASASEADARAVRYRFLRDLARKTGATAAALGHTRDDQVETILFRLVRGARLADLAGMPPARPLPGTEARIVRPLIEVTRQEVLDFLEAAGQPFREDRTNRDTRYARNRIRHMLLPLLEERYNPEVRGRLLDLAEVARAWKEELARRTEKLLAEGQVKVAGGRASLPVDLLRRTAPAVREELLRRLVEALGGRPALSRKTLAHLEEFCGHGTGRGTGHGTGRGAVSSRWVPLGAGLRARMTYGRLTIEPVPGRGPAAAPADPHAGPAGRSAVPLRVGGVTRLPHLGLRIESAWGIPPPDPPRVGPWEAVLDADAIAGPLFVRTRRPGDRFQPLGAPGRRKLKDFLMDRKVPADRRDRVPLLCDREGIVWVVGHAIAERARVTDRTRRVLRLEAEPVLGAG